MTKQRVQSSTSTHFAQGQEKVKVEDAEFGVKNSQAGDMLLKYPEDTEDRVSTHTSGDIHFEGDKKPVKAAAAKVAVKKVSAQSMLKDEELPTGGKIAEIPNEEDPSKGYLEQEAGMPVIHNASVEDEDAPKGNITPGDTVEADFEEVDEFGDDDEPTEVHSGEEFEGEEFVEDEVDADAEFEDLADMEGFPEGEEHEVAADEEPEVTVDEAPLPFDEPAPDTEAVALADVDGMDDDAEGCAFATFANVVHVVKGNRIIASMTPMAARKAGMSDVYLTDQFQDVVAHTMETRGLRKGLVQSGFVLAKVKITSSKVQAKVINARVDAALKTKLESAAKQDKAMDQALAIAAVGINRRFFKDTPNELKASLETELQRLGVRGGSNLVRAAFAQHGVSYARAIVTLAKKLAAMPEEHRNQFAEALDLTEDSEFEAPMDDEGEDLDIEVEEAPEPVPASLQAALLRPAHRNVGTTVKASAGAMSILTGQRPLV